MRFEPATGYITAILALIGLTVFLGPYWALGFLVFLAIIVLVSKRL